MNNDLLIVIVIKAFISICLFFNQYYTPFPLSSLLIHSPLLTLLLPLLTFIFYFNFFSANSIIDSPFPPSFPFSPSFPESLFDSELSFPSDPSESSSLMGGGESGSTNGLWDKVPCT